jgi:hypothetical protein
MRGGLADHGKLSMTPGKPLGIFCHALDDPF